MRIYLAARYSRRLELCQYREELLALGYDVQSRWLNGGHQISDKGIPISEKGEALVEGDDGSTDVSAAALRGKFARDDWEDVRDADAVISFTELPRSEHSRGGRHVELGIALGLEKLVIVVGHRENIFHWLTCVMFYPEWDSALRMLKSIKTDTINA